MAQQLVLIADDNPDTRLIFKLILEDRGFAVLEAVDGQEAVERAKLHRPDLIFMDLMMPVMDGWGAVARLRGEAEGVSGIPVVAVTAYDAPRERIQRAGFCGLVIKPVAPGDIVRAASVCLEARRRGEKWIPDLLRQIREA